MYSNFYLQIDVAVNAPEPGTIKELLANEEDTVTVGQDLLKLEPGTSSEGGQKKDAAQKPKDPAPQEQPTSSDPKPETSEKSPPKQPKDVDSAKQPEAPKQPKRTEEPKKDTGASKDGARSVQDHKQREADQKSDPALGNREEKRVCLDLEDF